jgi:class 3 adenylate cyclase
VLPKSEKACFVIADVSGYTKFLVSSELEHAQDIIVDFMDTVVEALRPTFRLAKFEGDAAFLYAVGNNLDGSLLEDTIETAYFKFRRRKRDVRQSSACKCKACASMGDLDLKFVIHHGEMVKQSMGGREELCRPGCHPCSQVAQEPRQREVRPSRLCPLQRRLYQGYGCRSGGARAV